MQSRVVQCAVGERSYHIFYHLCAGAPQSLRSMLLCPKLCFSYQESFVLVTLYSYLMLSTGKMVHLLKCIILDSRIIVSYNVASRLEKKGEYCYIWLEHLWHRVLQKQSFWDPWMLRFVYIIHCKKYNQYNYRFGLVCLMFNYLAVCEMSRILHQQKMRSGCIYYIQLHTKNPELKHSGPRRWGLFHIGISIVVDFACDNWSYSNYLILLLELTMPRLSRFPIPHWIHNWGSLSYYFYFLGCYGM